MIRRRPGAVTPKLEEGIARSPPVLTNEKAIFTNESSDKPAHKATDPAAYNEPHTVPTSHKTLEAQDDHPYASHCRADAPIWARYLEETEIEDKELTDIWNNSLDSLLVFAGLFAAILTAFLIESSKDLKEDPQEHLLKQILNTLRNVSDTSSFEPETSSLQINALWFTSLVISLISALGGVLAKGWLAKYNPASRQVHTSHACERHLRASRAREWQLAPLITAIPLLIQISLFLFFAGLIIQVRDRELRIWSIIVSLVGSVALLYIAGTILPWFSPACPFHTPISDFLPGIASKSQYRESPMTSHDSFRPQNSWRNAIWTYVITAGRFLDEVCRKPDKIVLQAQILSWMITNSAKDSTIKEAINTIAGSKQTKELQQALVQAGARERLHKAFQSYVRMTPGLPKAITNGDQVESLLYALLRIEQPLGVDIGPVDNLPYTSLLDEGQCLRRWDDFESHLQALVFSLRVHVLVNCDKDDHDENWAVTEVSINRMADTGFPPHIRGLLLFAALRGFLNGHTILRKTCEPILVKQLFIADVRKMICTPGSFVRRYSDEPSEIAILDILSRKIGQLCGGDDPGSRKTCAQILIKCADYGKLYHLTAMTLPDLAILFKRKDGDVLRATASMVIELPVHVKIRETVGPVIPSLVKLLKDAEENIRYVTVSTLGRLAERDELHEAIRPVISSLAELLKDDIWKVRKETVYTLAKLIDHVELRQSILPIIPSFVELLKDGDWKVRSEAISALGRMAEHAELHEAIHGIISSLVILLENKDKIIRSTSVSALGKLAEYVELHSAIRPVIPSLVNLLKKGTWKDRKVTVSALSKLAENVQLHDAIRPVIPSLTELLKDDTQTVRHATISTVSKLAEHAGLHEAIRPIIPSLVELLEDTASNIQSAAVSTLSKLAKDVELHEVIVPAIPQVASLLKDDDWTVRVEAISTFAKLIEHIELHDAISPVISSFLQLFKDVDRRVRCASVSALVKVSECVKLYDPFHPIIPALVGLLQDTDQEVRSAAGLAMVRLVDYVDLHGTMIKTIPTLLDLLAKRGFSARFQVSTTIFRLSNSTQLFPSQLHASVSHPILSICLSSSGLNKLSASTSDVTQASTADFYQPCSSSLLAVASKNVVSGPVLTNLAQLQSLINSKESYKVHTGIEALCQLAQIFHEVAQPVGKVVEKLIMNSRKECFQGIFDLAKHPNFVVAISATNLTGLIKNHPMDIASALGKLADHVGIYDAIRPVIPSLVELLKNADEDVLSAAVSAFENLAVHSGLHNEIRAVVPSMIELLDNGSWRARYAAVCALGNLANNVLLFKTHESFHRIAPSLVDLIQDVNDKVRSATINALGKLAVHDELHNTITPIIPRLIEFLKDTNRYVQSSAAFALGQLASHVNLDDIINSFIPYLVASLRDGRQNIRQTTDVLAKLLEHVDREAIRSIIPSVAEGFKDQSENVRSAAVSAIAMLGWQSEMHEIIRLVIPSVAELFKDQSEYVRSAAVSAIAMLGGQSELHEIIRLVIPSVAELFKDQSEYVQSTAVSAIAMLGGQSEMHGTIRLVIPSVVELLKDRSQNLRRVAISTLAQMARDNTFEDLISQAISSFVGMIKDEASYVRPTTIVAIAQMAENGELHKAMLPMVPVLVGLLKSGEEEVQSVTFSAVIALINQVEPYEANNQIIPAFVALLKSKSSKVRNAAVSAFGKLANHVQFYDALNLFISPLIELIKDDEEDVRSATVYSLSKLIEHDELRQMFRRVIPSLVELLKDNQPKARISAGRAIELLLKYPDIRDDIFKLKPPDSWLEYLHDSDPDALAVFTEIICFLYYKDYIHMGIVQALLDAQNALDDPNPSVRACGATIILTMGTHARLRNIICEVYTIHACIERYLEGATRHDADMILQRMEYFGILKEL